MRDDPDDDFERHEPDDQKQRDRQVSAIRIGADGVRVVAIVMMAAVVADVSLVVQRGYLPVTVMISRRRPVRCSQSRWPERDHVYNGPPRHSKEPPCCRCSLARFSQRTLRRR